ncbi:MAG: SGNH/GDSL hydrolase family protein [Defluviitaleaceae bacterium]|nr:SGNH/GDSL hydrolase family protein [Defluviitaleaceae bacterium]
MYVLKNTVRFPHDAESGAFFGALATVLLPALGYTEETPYFCGQKDSFCFNCENGCKATAMQKNHLQLYHNCLTYTGAAFGYAWPESDSDYCPIPGRGKSWFYPDDFFDFIFGYAGLSWTRLNKEQKKEEAFADLKRSIDSGMPALMKFGAGSDWHVMVGYGDDMTIYAIDHKPLMKPKFYTEDGLAAITDWLGQLTAAIIITGGAKRTVGFNAILTQMILSLHKTCTSPLEKEVNAKLDGVNEKNAAQTAKFLADTVGFAIEARWHAAEAMTPFMKMTDSEAVREQLMQVLRNYIFDSDCEATHGTCWKIWRCLGISAETGYALPNGSEGNLHDEKNRGELKKLFAAVFENDRVVIKHLREAARLTMDFEKYPVPELPMRGGSGAGLAGFMKKLAESTADKPNHVKIAFTGQSIVDPNNTWPPMLADWLRGQYPNAVIHHKVFAIGGFSTQVLYKRVPNDIASFYPDLLVIMVQGSEVQYERLIKWVRENTTSEILIMTDHFTSDDKWGYNWWSLKMSYELLPAIAKRHGAQVADIRTPWRKYFEDTGLSPQGLLSDGGHLFDTGQEFMFRLIRQFFVYNSAAKIEERCTFIPVCKDDWKNGKLAVQFDGNRVEAVAGSGLQHPCEVRIDGRKPSETPEAYIRTAENNGIYSKLGIVEFVSPPGEQKFTITLKTYTDPLNFSYTVEGSETGFEGESDLRGNLCGKRIKLTHESFIFYYGHPDPKPGETYSFFSLLNGTDIYDAAKPYKGHIEKAELFCPYMIVSGIANGSHTVELAALSETPDITGFKVYRP